jgi:hypothetical protein
MPNRHTAHSILGRRDPSQQNLDISSDFQARHQCVCLIALQIIALHPLLTLLHDLHAKKLVEIAARVNEFTYQDYPEMVCSLEITFYIRLI